MGRLQGSGVRAKSMFPTYRLAEISQSDLDHPVCKKCGRRIDTSRYGRGGYPTLCPRGKCRKPVRRINPVNPKALTEQARIRAYEANGAWVQIAYGADTQAAQVLHRLARRGGFDVWRKRNVLHIRIGAA